MVSPPSGGSFSFFLTSVFRYDWEAWELTEKDGFNVEMSSLRYRKKLLEAARAEKLVEGQVKFLYIHIYAENADHRESTFPFDLVVFQ